MQRVDEDPGVGPTDVCDDVGCRGARSPTSIHEGNSRSTVRPKSSGEVAESTEPLGGSVPIGIRQLADDVAGADRRRRLEQPEEVVGLLVRSEPSELDVEHPHAGVGQRARHPATIARSPTSGTTCSPGATGVVAEADVVVAGVGGDLDLLERRRAEHREVGEGELGGHRRIASSRQGAAVP